MNLHPLPQPDCLTQFPQDLTCALSSSIPLLMRKTSLPFCPALTPQCLAEPVLGAPSVFAERKTAWLSSQHRGGLTLNFGFLGYPLSEIFPGFSHPHSQGLHLAGTSLAFYGHLKEQNHVSLPFNTQQGRHPPLDCFRPHEPLFLGNPLPILQVSQIYDEQFSKSDRAKTWGTVPK